MPERSDQLSVLYHCNSLKFSNTIPVGLPSGFTEELFNDSSRSVVSFTDKRVSIWNSFADQLLNDLSLKGVGINRERNIITMVVNNLSDVNQDLISSLTKMMTWCYTISPTSLTRNQWKYSVLRNRCKAAHTRNNVRYVRQNKYSFTTSYSGYLVEFVDGKANKLLMKMSEIGTPLKAKKTQSRPRLSLSRCHTSPCPQ